MSEDQTKQVTGATKITSTESAVASDAEKSQLPAGVPEGTIDKENPEIPEAVRERIEHREVVVHEYDKDGNVIGWHKEAARDGGDE